MRTAESPRSRPSSRPPRACAAETLQSAGGVERKDYAVPLEQVKQEEIAVLKERLQLQRPAAAQA